MYPDPYSPASARANPHDRYFDAQRVQTARRTLGDPLPRRKRTGRVRAFLAGLAVGLAAGYLLSASEAHAGSRLAQCESEAADVRALVELRDDGYKEERVQRAFADVARDHPEYAPELPVWRVRIAEVWSWQHLSAREVVAFALHRCLYLRKES